MSHPVEVGRFPFRFHCVPGCTNCCTRSGHVYLTEADIARIAAHLKMTGAEFEARYLTREDGHPRLRMGPKERCFFLREGGCAIHAVKPLQCSVFPYWPENVGTRAAWHRLRRYCPGIGVGPLVQIETVRRQAEAYREAFPDL